MKVYGFKDDIFIMIFEDDIFIMIFEDDILVTGNLLHSANSNFDAGDFVLLQKWPV